MLLTLSLALATLSRAAEQEIPSLLGSWEGSFLIGQDSTNLAFTITETEGAYHAALISSAMGIFGMPAEMIELDGLRLVIRIPRIDGVFTGRLRMDDAGEKIERIDGDWFQFAEMLPVTLLPVEQPSF